MPEATEDLLHFISSFILMSFGILFFLGLSRVIEKGTIYNSFSVMFMICLLGWLTFFWLQRIMTLFIKYIRRSVGKAK